MEMRLFYAAALNGAVLYGAFCFARRRAIDLLDRLCDTLLLWFAVQYAAIVLPGLAHVLNPLSIAIVALLLTGGLTWMARPKSQDGDAAFQRNLTQATPADGRWLISCGLFVCGALASWMSDWSLSPPTATDALAYHFPVAAQWLREGRLSLLPTWFFNPANTYSPLAGSTFIAWWMAPLHNDVLARFVQIPPLLLIFLAMARIGKSLGAGMGIAVIVAAAAVLSRPLLSEAVLGKDDLYQAAFFCVAVAGCVPYRLRGPWGTSRIGISIGLMLATKYTALLSLPILLLIVNAPFAAGWRAKRWATAVGWVLLLCAPWYLRNLLLNNNPVFPINVGLMGRPIFAGLFSTTRATDDLNTWAGLWKVLTQGYYAVPVLLAVILTGGWLMAFVVMHLEVRAGRNLKFRHPTDLQRLCLMGPIVGMALFAFTAPYAEVRFLLPSLLLLFAGIGGGLQLLVQLLSKSNRQHIIAGVPAAALLAVSLYTTHNAKVFVRDMLLVGALVAAIGSLFIVGFRRINLLDEHRRREIMGGVVCIVLLGLAGLIYVEWKSYVLSYRAMVDPTELTDGAFWQSAYAEGPAWRFIRREVPETVTIAYANTYLVYPLLGFELTRRAVYVSPHADIERIDQLPRLSTPMSGDQMEGAYAAILNSNPDRQTWLRRLHEAGAQYLLVIKAARGLRAPELDLANTDPTRFTLVYDDSIASVYRIAPW